MEAASDDTRTIGRRLREVRYWRRKSLKVVAELAGISEGYLSKLESGHSALDRRSLLVALANALQVAPSELVALPFPPPGDGGTDAAVEGVRHARCRPTTTSPVGECSPLTLCENGWLGPSRRAASVTRRRLVPPCQS